VEDEKLSKSPPVLRPGLRLQIVLALAGLMLLAFVPLFFAVASLTRATVLGAREQAARALGRAIAAHVVDAWASRVPGNVDRVLDDVASGADVESVCVFTLAGSRVACAGSPVDRQTIRAPPPGSTESMTMVHDASGRALEIVSPGRDLVVVSHMSTDHSADGGGKPLVRLVALYMITFALALLVFAYFVLTRLIVRPVEQLVEAADRVASGARTLRVPTSGARELIELGASVRAMTEKLITEEAALLLKVEELTQTTTRLTQTQGQLVRSERMASVGRLAAGVAHEIGNPITALLGMEELLLGDLEPDIQRDFLLRMRRETERIHTVLRDLLDFARPEEMQSAGVEPAPSDVRAVVDDVVSLVRPQKPFRGMTIDVRVDGSPSVTLPSSRLTQVLLNIVLNAGAAVASSKRTDGRVTIRARQEGSARVRIEVDDNGPGIAPAVRERLFEPFVTTKEVGEGTGLGLAVCRGLVESAGGEIGVEPSAAEGARFYVVLPSASS
jgi:two-component system, NtrC family, sensor kinase